LSSLNRDPDGEDLLQVHFPHLQDTVEILQVEHVLERMNVFLRLMHEGLVTNSSENKQVDVERALAKGRRPVEVIGEKLRTAFPIAKWATVGDVATLAVGPEVAASALVRLEDLRKGLGNRLGIDWSPMNPRGQLLGTMKLARRRIQPFTLFLDSVDGWLMVRCVSPIGIVDLDDMRQAIEDSVRRSRVRLGAVIDREPESYNLTVQEDVILGDRADDVARVESMLQRVAEQADYLELIHLPGADRALDIFAEELQREGLHPSD
jgi:hypothetical protein